METHPISLEALRADFPVIARTIDGQQITYLDSAATSLKPQPVIDAVVHYYSVTGANIHRGKHYLSEEASDKYEEARYKVAQYLGAQGNEVVFVRNTTEALNLVASGMELAPTDIVIGCLDSHHSQQLPWRRAADLRLVNVTADGHVDLDHYAELLKLKPRVVAITHCSNVTGAFAPIETMTAMAKEYGAIVVVDAAQSMPHRRIDVSKLPADFVAFSAHKMLGPTGVGCLYGRFEQLDRLRPAIVGGGMVDWVDLDGSRERKLPHRLEAGTPAIASVIGFGAAIDYLTRIGDERLRAHDAMLSECILRGALQRDYLTVLGPRDSADRAALGTLRVRDCDSLSDLTRALSDSYGIMCRNGHMCAQPIVDAHASGEVLRASAYVYNTPAEIDRFYEAMDELVRVML